MPRPYPPEKRAAVLAELATGASVSATARAHGVDRATVIAWRDLSDQPVAQQKRADLGEQLYGYLDESIAALRSQLRTFGDEAWLKKQPAGELAILHGVIADKTTRLLQAIRPESEPGESPTVIDARADPR